MSLGTMIIHYWLCYSIISDRFRVKKRGQTINTFGQYSQENKGTIIRMMSCNILVTVIKLSHNASALAYYVTMLCTSYMTIIL